VTRADADRWARIAAVVVGAVGLVLVLVPAALHADRIFADDPFSPPGQRDTVVKQLPDGGTEETTTIGPAEEPLIVRTLGAGGLLVLRLGIVVMGAFIAGAVVQRALIGRFSFELNLPDDPDERR
jgi:hypothetical protein